MPLGNLTSQFFANVYLNELDYFAKHKLKAKYYIRYVDDFVILHNSKDKLVYWKKEINKFLKERLKLELHPDKSKIISLSRGVDFVGFRNFYYHHLLRGRNIRNMRRKIRLFNQGKISYSKFLEIFQGWQAYAKWANSYKLIDGLIKKEIKI
ncbi:reverse transcriptase [archaeon BMS3Abin17]|nr:reverse transcriptase [archaeon BMS3Abin17]